MSLDEMKQLLLQLEASYGRMSLEKSRLNERMRLVDEAMMNTQPQIAMLMELIEGVSKETQEDKEND